jgi:hypothetical protein
MDALVPKAEGGKFLGENGSLYSMVSNCEGALACEEGAVNDIPYADGMLYVLLEYVDAELPFAYEYTQPMKPDARAGVLLIINEINISRDFFNEITECSSPLTH